MKKVITFFFVFLTLLWTIPTYGQANRQQFCRVRDRTNPNSLANVLQLTLTMPTTSWGLVTKSGTYFYSSFSTTFLPWTGARQNLDTVAHATEAPFVGSFTYGINRAGNQWSRVSAHVLTGTFANTEIGLATASAGYHWDINNSLWTYNQGEQANSDTVAVTAAAPYSLSLGYFYDQNNGDWNRDTGDELSTDAVPTTTIAPYRGTMGHIYLTDGDVWARDKGELADGGNIATSISAAYRFSLNYGWNGTNWQKFLIGASGEVQVTDVAVRPGEDSGNDWRKAKKEETAAVTPNVVTTTVDQLEDIFPSREIVHDVNWTICVYNDGADFTDLSIEVSPDGGATFGWQPLTLAPANGGYSGIRNDDCTTTLADGANCCFSVYGSSYRYLRVQANCATSTTAYVWYTANKN